MRILKYKGKLVEEVGYVTGEKVVFLKYVRTDDMPKCECGRHINQEISIVEGCMNWGESVRGVDTIGVHVCCDGECNHDTCCGKIEENCPNYQSNKRR